MFQIAGTDLGSSYDGGPNFPAGTWFQPWQDDMHVGALGYTALLHPEWLDVARFFVKQPIARLDPASGWCPGVPTRYMFRFRDVHNGPVYPDWGTAWTKNAPALGVCPPQIDLSGAGAYDYLNTMRAGLALCAQAGVVEVQRALTSISTQLLAGLAGRRGQMEFKWSIA